MDSEVSAEERVPINQEDDIVVARQRAREVAKSLEFGRVDQSRIATAVSELTRNVVRYATEGRGEVFLRSLLTPEGRVGIEIVVRDDGPGIPDLDLVWSGSYSSSHGMGMGLLGTRRLMDEMDVDTQAGRGTVVTIRKWRR